MRKALGRRETAQGRRRPHLLRHRRHLARARAAAHVADRLSAARDARLRDPGQGGATSSRAWCTASIRRRCRRSRWWPTRAGRCSPMRRWCSNTWCDIARPKEVVISALGVREGLLYSLLDARGAPQGPADRGRRRAQRAALALARPRRGADRLDRPLHGLVRPRRDRRGAAAAPRRLPARRHRLARASRTIAASSRSTSSPTRPSSAIDHPGRTFLALAVFFRHVGLIDEELSPRLRELASTRVLDRARVLGAALRVAYLVSASTTGVLPKTPMLVERGRLVLRFENGLAGARRRARVQPAAPARAPDRPRAGDGRASRASPARRRRRRRRCGRGRRRWRSPWRRRRGAPRSCAAAP